MESLSLPGLPEVLKPIAHFLKVSNEHASRDPVITYWCRLHALQTGMKLDKKSKESLGILIPLMDWLESEKKLLKDREEISSDIVASAHVENYALKLFSYADKEDRASHFDKNVVRAFYTSGILLEVLAVFGELSPEVAKAKKYAKWKAAYIHKCLKEGETPVPGPLETENEEDDLVEEELRPPSPKTYSPPPPQPQEPIPEPSPDLQRKSSLLDPNVVIKAQKYCKYATNALDFADKDSAIDNLQKALRLLETGADE